MTTKKAEAIGKRIKQVREDQMLTQTQFGSYIGVKGNTVTGYEGGTRTPSDSVINNICKTFNVNETWLRSGETEMYIPVPDLNTPLEKVYSDFNCNQLEIKFLNAYFGLSEKERYAFCETLTKMFPDALQKIVGQNPLQPTWEEAPPLEDVDSEMPVEDIKKSFDGGDEEDYANLAREQRLLEEEAASQASSAKDSDVG